MRKGTITVTTSWRKAGDKRKKKKQLHLRVPNILVQISMARYLFAEKWKGGRFVPFFIS